MLGPGGPPTHGSHRPPGGSPLSQKAKYSVFMEWCGPMLRRIMGSVPRKLLSVAEYSSPSMGDSSQLQTVHEIWTHPANTAPSGTKSQGFTQPAWGAATHPQGGQCGL